MTAGRTLHVFRPPLLRVLVRHQDDSPFERRIRAKCEFMCLTEDPPDIGVVQIGQGPELEMPRLVAASEEPLLRIVEGRPIVETQIDVILGGGDVDEPLDVAVTIGKTHRNRIDAARNDFRGPGRLGHHSITRCERKLADLG